MRNKVSPTAAPCEIPRDADVHMLDRNGKGHKESKENEPTRINLFLMCAHLPTSAPTDPLIHHFDWSV